MVIALLLLAFAGSSHSLWSQAAAPAPLRVQTPSAPAEPRGQLLLVLPFDNQLPQASLDWIGAAVPEVLNRRFASAGFLPISSSDRAYALDHLGLPHDFRPSHASTLRLAQAVDAEYVVLGTYRVEARPDGSHITAAARVLDVRNLKMSAPLEEQASLAHLADVLNSLAWRVTRQIAPAYPVAEQTFLSADAGLRLDVFEHYVRGIDAGSESADRVRHLREAVRLAPQYYPAWLALGQALFASQEYEQAANAFGHLTRTDPNALEADFYRGLAYFYTGKYLQAEDAFAFVSTRLPLPEVVNNQGVAAARRGKSGAPFFQQATTADPREGDYHFNLAIALARQNNAPGALLELDQAVKLRPQDAEAQAFAANLHNAAYLAALGRSAAQAPVAATTATPAASTASPAQGAAAEPNLPLERIKRSYNEAGFRQAAFAMEQMDATRRAAMPAAQRASLLVQNGDHYLNAGLLVEAEREYGQALTVNPASSPAHAGLAQIRERTGDRDAARAEAQRSLDLAPNVPAHLVLARLDLLTSQLPAAAREVQAALQIAPSDANARGLKQAIESRGQQVAQ